MSYIIDRLAWARVQRILGPALLMLAVAGIPGLSKAASKPVYPGAIYGSDIYINGTHITFTVAAVTDMNGHGKADIVGFGGGGTASGSSGSPGSGGGGGFGLFGLALLLFARFAAAGSDGRGEPDR